MNDLKNSLWVERYRPAKVEDIVLPKELTKTFKQVVAKGDIPNMILSGPAGSGKTTVAKAICNELKLDYMIINGSMDGGIDTLRHKVQQFASTVSLMGGSKVVILDEADYLTPVTQASLRNFIEEFSSNCRFILTCNFKHKIIEPLWSRCSVYEFVIPNAEKAQMAGEFFRRCVDILNENSIKFDPKALAGVIEKFFPDWRRVLNELQRYSLDGELSLAVLSDNNGDAIKTLVGYLKDRDFKNMRKWVGENPDIESSTLYRLLYDNLTDFLMPESVPQAILTIADYQFKAGHVADIEINTAASLTELMMLDFK